MTNPTASDARDLGPYLPNLVVRWLAESPATTALEHDASVVLVDISGFTQMSERLARHGRIGAEEVSETIGSVFARLLALAYANEGSLLKFGGDALLLVFDGEAHEVKAAGAAAGMRAALREIGPIPTSAGRVTLRMSVGVSSGRFTFFLVGDSHRELVVAGSAATETVLMETTAAAGEIVVSAATAGALPGQSLGPAKGPGILLRRPPGQVEGLPPERPPVPSHDVLANGIPVALRTHLLDGAADPEHRRATVAFVGFGGTDALIAGGIEAGAATLHELVSLTQTAADTHGVTFLATDIDRDGGKVILVAGAPRAQGDDEERMLLTLRGIVEAGAPLPIRIGVNRGHVFAGDVGPPYRRTYTVMGDAVNLAARLMAKAETGQILATSSVLDGSLTAFRRDRVEPFTVKGKKAPVTAEVVGPAVGSRSLTVDELPFVGRHDEIAALEAALESARQGSGRLVEIVGAPGMGKTRLLGELTRRAAGSTVLSASCELYSSSTPYLPFRLLLRNALGIPTEAAKPDAARQLRAAVRRHAPALVRWLPLVAVPLDLELPATRESRELAEEFVRETIEETVMELLRQTLAGPTVLIIEDVHWLDEASSDLLGRLAGDASDRPWLVCVTRRAEETGFVASDLPQSVRLDLSPLTKADAVELLVEATEDSPLHRHEVTALAERSGGNPLFVRELLRVARETGGVHELPDSIEAMAVAQIDRLAAADRRLLRRAAVLGVGFDDKLLEALFDEPPVGRSAWERLADVVVEDGQGRHRFRHALIRDAAYEGLPFSRRCELHSRAGEEIERRAAETGEEQAELLSLHFFHARRFGAAWRYSWAAGDRARAKYANVEAGDFYRRALGAARHVADVSDTDLCAVLESLGDVCDRVGAYEEASAALRQARKRRSGDPVASARLLRREAELAESSGRYVQSLRLLGKGLRSLEGMPGPDAAAERANLAVWYASGRMRQGRHREALRWCQRAIDEAGLAGDRESLAWAYLVLDSISVELALATSEPYAELALSIYKELGDLGRQAGIMLNLGGRAYYESRWVEALSLYERARELYTRTGNTANAADAMFNIGEILCHQGRFDEGEPLLRDATRIWRAAGDRVGVTLARSELARAAYRRGAFDGTLSELEQARAEFHAAGADVDVLETELRIAECLLLGSDDLPRASLLLASVLERVDAEGEVAEVRLPRILRLRAWALALGDRFDDARAAFEESIRVGRAAHADFDVAMALDGLSRLELPADRDDAASLKHESRQLLGQLGVVATAPELTWSPGADPGRTRPR